MRMPHSVRVGHRLYELVSWEPAAADAEGALGDCRDEPPVIRINKGMTRPDRAATMLHELLHACWRRMPSKGVDEEMAVTVLAENLAQVWVDNPSLITWISECLSKR